MKVPACLALSRYVDDRRVEIDGSATERVPRRVEMHLRLRSLKYLTRSA
jgi:hypothetical protein